ncbi:MAG TPA: alanine racemase [Burkholderiaceae bacterium]|nr:alanine racemase [Burkholderiaceae bacterium]
MPRPLVARIDDRALSANLSAARARAGQRRIWAVAKANAYGHGLERAVRAFADADGLGLLEVEEAQRAREKGWKKPILLLEGVFDPGELDEAARLGLTCVVHCVEQIEMIERRSGRAPLDVYLKLDSGMNRLGFTAGQAAGARRRLESVAGVRLAALMSHLANADRLDPGPCDVASQRRVFAQLCGGFGGDTSLCNSAALFLHPDLGDGWVRPGIALYGSSPGESASAAALGLRAAMALNSELIAVRTVPTAGRVGYGSRWSAPVPTRLGVVACGYADGYPRSAPDGTPVWVAGRRAALVGRVSMDMLTVDLTGIDDAGIGSPVQLWGEHVAIDEVARQSQRVAYELMCGLNPRVRVSDAH